MFGASGFDPQAKPSDSIETRGGLGFKGLDFRTQRVQGFRGLGFRDESLGFIGFGGLGSIGFRVWRFEFRNFGRCAPGP